jgi:hypothetical protein
VETIADKNFQQILVLRLFAECIGNCSQEIDSLNCHPTQSRLTKKKIKKGFCEEGKSLHKNIKT